MRRLEEGLEQGLTLVIAKGSAGPGRSAGPEQAAAVEAIRTGVGFGVRNREAGWGAGLTVLTAMANVLPRLDPTTGRWPSCTGWRSYPGTRGAGRPGSRWPRWRRSVPAERLMSWYRRFIDTRNGDAAERVLATATARGAKGGEMVALMGAAATDHVFLDGGHTIDFTNKAFEVLDHLGWERAGEVLPTLAHETARAGRAEETGAVASPRRHRRPAQDRYRSGLGTGRRTGSMVGEQRAAPGTGDPTTAVDALAWAILEDDPGRVVAALDKSAAGGASRRRAGPGRGLRRRPAPDPLSHPKRPRRLGCRPPRFHDGQRRPPDGLPATPRRSCARGIYQGAMRVFLDRFLNVPAARLAGGSRPTGPSGRTCERLHDCLDQEGMVDEAGAIVYGWLRSGGGTAPVVRALGSALLAEDAEFHWFQTYEAAVRQTDAWPAGSEQAALILGRRGPLPGRPHPDAPGTGPGGADRGPAAPGRGAVRGDLSVRRRIAGGAGAGQYGRGRRPGTRAPAGPTAAW